MRYVYLLGSEFCLDSCEAKGLCNSFSIFRVSFVEVFNRPFLNISGNWSHVFSCILNGILFRLVVVNLSEENTWLFEVAIRMVWFVSGNKTCNPVRLVSCFLVETKCVGSR